METNNDMELLGRDWTEEYLEYYVKKYLEDYEDSTSDTSDGSDLSLIDWDFQKTGKIKIHLRQVIRSLKFSYNQFR